ncbi:group 3 secretory phospholipase A2 [Pleuronectes platessa]|uniref:group 3 secretory phospholipase A2 n=1 Tax=Pleuronectes platessa TaxID=8262 RepID=UPI00232A71D6|nr:group 3 secretory phospholipase A2 [Pleuronectes platessa]
MGSGDSGDSCLRSSPTRDGQTRVTFLREDARGARSLHLSLWSADRRLVTCEVNSSPLATESYRTLCGRSEPRLQDEEFTRRFNFSVLEAPDSPCAPFSSSSAPQFSRRTRRTGTGGKVRRKRGWLFPGTLWCGRGSEAVRYEQLGMFENADRCCREHDHCSHIIPSFTVNYGVFNSYFYTLSHCDCDQRFRQCLLEVNDTISSMVHYSFFNILRIPCFELKQQKQCTLKYWWGMCKVAKEAPYAVFKSPLPYNTSDVSSKYGDSANRSSLTNSQLLCGSLRYLDDCKYQIPPLEKKYDLQNMESKTAYHCDCTTRLALQIKSFKQPRVLPTLLMDFISQYCFKLLKENKCRQRKSCSGGFIKASDLLRTLKMEGKDSGEVQNSGNERKRGIPVRLYKRCLRLQREADIMAQLT